MERRRYLQSIVGTTVIGSVAGCLNSEPPDVQLQSVEYPILQQRSINIFNENFQTVVNVILTNDGSEGESTLVPVPIPPDIENKKEYAENEVSEHTFYTETFLKDQERQISLEMNAVHDEDKDFVVITWPNEYTVTLTNPSDNTVIVEVEIKYDNGENIETIGRKNNIQLLSQSTESETIETQNVDNPIDTDNITAEVELVEY